MLAKRYLNANSVNEIYTNIEKVPQKQAPHTFAVDMIVFTFYTQIICNPLNRFPTIINSSTLNVQCCTKVNFRIINK